MRLFGYPYNDLVICKDSPDYLVICKSFVIMNYFRRYFTIVYLFMNGFCDCSPSLLHIIFVHVKDMKIVIAFRNFNVIPNTFTYSLNLAFVVTKLASVFGIINNLEYLSDFLFIFFNKTLFIHVELYAFNVEIYHFSWHMQLYLHFLTH